MADMLVAAQGIGILDERTRLIVDRVRAAVADWKVDARNANVTSALVRDIDARLNGPGEGWSLQHT